MFIYNSGHSFECIHYLLPGANVMVKPVGNMLAGDAKRCPIFHKSNVVDVRHFRAPDAKLHPAYNISKNALSVIIEFLLYLSG